ncbi:hypothetical protein [Croceicoccus hydrothermalis]|uniref:hypothetical protein n=1 Tax=Croceicoccus hydrothermalis TaxID=2867964 RepID=UPI001EFBEFBB|nr:hypothetical protein [Croceicoccus hydrothermalis]
MKSGRIALDTPDDEVARSIVVEPDRGRVVDIARSAPLYFAGKRDAGRRYAVTDFPGGLPCLWNRSSLTMPKMS